jgi:hypothetical protein
VAVPPGVTPEPNGVGVPKAVGQERTLTVLGRDDVVEVTAFQLAVAPQMDRRPVAYRFWFQMDYVRAGSTGSRGLVFPVDIVAPAWCTGSGVYHELPTEGASWSQGEIVVGMISVVGETPWAADVLIRKVE